MAVSDRRQGADSDRLELLLFSLGGDQLFAINVLKVMEVMTTPELTRLPDAHRAVLGVTNFRGESVTVVDLARAVGFKGADRSGPGMVIIGSFNRVQVGFRVSAVDRIAVLDWKEVHRPPQTSSRASYITGVTYIDNHLVEILDVEKVLFETVLDEHVEFDLDGNAEFDDLADAHSAGDRSVLVVDDSAIARKQTARTLERLGVNYLMARDGREALDLLREKAQETQGEDIRDHIAMVISDIEMPEMDGYSLTRAIRQDRNLSDLYVLLHTSLTGVINTEQAERVGADATLTKFESVSLARRVVEGLTAGHGNTAGAAQS